eukprot:513218_1
MTGTDSDGDFYFSCSGFEIYGKIEHKLHQQKVRKTRQQDEKTESNTNNVSDAELKDEDDKDNSISLEEENFELEHREFMEKLCYYKNENLETYPDTLIEKYLKLIADRAIVIKTKYEIIKHEVLFVRELFQMEDIDIDINDEDTFDIDELQNELNKEILYERNS